MEIPIRQCWKVNNTQTSYLLDIIFAMWLTACALVLACRPSVSKQKQKQLKLNIVHYVMGLQHKRVIILGKFPVPHCMSLLLVMLWSSPSHDHLYNIHINRMSARMFTCQKVER